MKFIDEAILRVAAGKGGDGGLSFLREKFVPRGGPDGGDGGDGGSVYLEARSRLNTLVDYQHLITHRAESGQQGMGKQRTGKKGEDLILAVPVGTQVFENETDELIGDLTKDGERLLVAQGGFHGLGNTRFKSSINRAPRKTTKGSPGESRELRLELTVLADVGLLGLPNAGKSTFIRAVSAAKPRVADYPFTTLSPNLGVVRLAADESFVVADIPGLIEGAAEGAGLGIQFLKHLSRTSILLHLVDIAPPDGSDPCDSIKTIQNEVNNFNEELGNKEQWLVFTKCDLLDEDECTQIKNDTVQKLNWTGKVFTISSLTKTGTQALCYALMSRINATLSV